LQAVPAPNTYRGSDADRQSASAPSRMRRTQRPGNDRRPHPAHSMRRVWNRKDPLQLVPRSGGGRQARSVREIEEPFGEAVLASKATNEAQSAFNPALRTTSPHFAISFLM
jgi:hypothetical protein